MDILDLDQLRRARKEHEEEPAVVKFGGKEFTLPAETPYEFIELLRAGRSKDAIRLLLGEEQFEEFWSERPTEPDVFELTAWIARRTVGDDDAGGSTASDELSTSTTVRSKRTSSASTGNRSTRRSGARRR